MCQRSDRGAEVQPARIGSRRDAFLQHVASDALQGYGDSPGVLYRVAAQVQREFFDPPLETRSGTGKYRGANALGLALAC
jgi:hypothetical protein